MKCPECGNDIIIEKIPYMFNNQIYLGDFEAERCFKCGTYYFTEDSYGRIEKAAKTMKIWGVKRLPDSVNITTDKVNDIPLVNLMTLYGNTTLTRKIITVSA